jgi:hypothetical protein
LSFTATMARAVPSTLPSPTRSRSQGVAHIAMFCIFLVLALGACAAGEVSPLDGQDAVNDRGGRPPRDIGGAETGADTRDDVADATEDAREDGGPEDLGQTDLLGDGDADDDGAGADAIGEDAVEDVPPGGCPGRGCPCTPATAFSVCAGLACVDGYCCDSACAGTCEACDRPGRLGLCTPLPANTYSGGECAESASSTCGTTGFCDGAGGCAYFGASTTCDDGEACSSGDRCDGAGSCLGDVPETCGPGAGNECCVGTCSDSLGCRTIAGACPDVCGSFELSLGGSCGGCGLAGAVGTCTGGATYRCDAGSHDLCQSVSCGGTNYYCTEVGGNWAWRPSASCNDGDLCTYGDVCEAGGSCAGTPLTCADSTCADRECNGTATCTVTPRTGTACEDGDLCTHGDTCTSAGVCGAGARITCDDAGCLDRACNGTATCTETVRTGGACEDGNLCTYGDTCDSAGVCQSGSSLTCTGLDTACLAYACDGSSTCAASPRNVGGACDDGDPETDFDACQADGTCAGDPGCPPPPGSCANGTQSRDGCGNARIIGRTVAGTPSGFNIIDDTCGARDRFDESSGCWDANNDHTYRLYMREGERAWLRLYTGEPCSFDVSSWSGTLSIYETAGCDSTACGSRVACDYNERDQSRYYTAPRDGWVIIVADGSSAFDDEGAYQLTVILECRGGDCGC